MRKASLGITLVLCVIFSFTASPILAQCGVERWSVKTGTDADISQVNMSMSTPTTIAALRGLTAPGTLPSNNRVLPTGVVNLNATNALGFSRYSPYGFNGRFLYTRLGLKF